MKITRFHSTLQKMGKFWPLLQKALNIIILIQSTAGVFLAQYHKNLGDYFGGDDGSNWPHTPLYTDPMPLESEFNVLKGSNNFCKIFGRLSYSMRNEFF